MNFGKAEMEIVTRKVRQLWSSTLSSGLPRDQRDECLSRVLLYVAERIAKGEEIENLEAFAHRACEGVIAKLHAETKSNVIAGDLYAVDEIDIARNERRSWLERVPAEMTKAGGRVAVAAAALGVSRRTLETALASNRFSHLERAPKGRSRVAA